jgi:AcrR family transcriptional regulator
MPRPRSAKSHRKVLDAALGLVSERGIEATSMDAIAEASGVSKATIYKHWKDKDALLLEMMAELAGLHSRPEFDTGDTRVDLVAVLAYQAERNAELKNRILPHFMAYAARQPSFGLAWRQMVMEPPRKELRQVLQAGIRKGELSSKLDVEMALALLLGPMIYCHVFQGNTTRFVRRDLAEGVAEAFFRAFGIPVRTSAPPRYRKASGNRPQIAAPASTEASR